MEEYGFSLTRILPHKDRKIRVSENPYSGLFYVVMSADSFILAFRRLISRRGNIRMIRTDNGTNFCWSKHRTKESIQ